jgi:hypothetical protein
MSIDTSWRGRQQGTVDVAQIGPYGNLLTRSDADPAILRTWGALQQSKLSICDDWVMEACDVVFDALSG